MRRDWMSKHCCDYIMTQNSSIDFESLRYLSVSAESGNFVRAGQSLGVQTSTVSRRVARLEDKLGVTLLNAVISEYA